MSLTDADFANGRTLGPSVAAKPEPKSAQDYFPRSRWDELMQPRKEAAQSSMADRIRYATRLASEHWSADVREQAEDCINVDLCKLAVLDKVFEMCEEYRQLQEQEPRDFEAWRAISAGFVGKVVQLVSGRGSGCTDSRHTRLSNGRTTSASISGRRFAGSCSWRKTMGIDPGQTHGATCPSCPSLTTPS